MADHLNEKHHSQLLGTIHRAGAAILTFIPARIRLASALLFATPQTNSGIVVALAGFRNLVDRYRRLHHTPSFPRDQITHHTPELVTLQPAPLAPYYTLSAHTATPHHKNFQPLVTNAIIVATMPDPRAIVDPVRQRVIADQRAAGGEGEGREWKVETYRKICTISLGHGAGRRRRPLLQAHTLQHQRRPSHTSPADSPPTILRAHTPHTRATWCSVTT